MSRPIERGQATVEWISTVVLVALMMGALALWSARELRPPARPPDPVAVVVAPLARTGEQFGLALGRADLDLPAIVARLEPGSDMAVTAFEMLTRATRGTLRLGRDMGAAFGVRFADRLRERLQEIIDNPPTAADMVPDPADMVPGQIVNDLVAWATRDPEALVEYVRSLDDVPPRDAAVMVAGDAGAVTADGALKAAEYLLKRVIFKGVLRTVKRPPGRR